MACVYELKFKINNVSLDFLTEGCLQSFLKLHANVYFIAHKAYLIAFIHR